MNIYGIYSALLNINQATFASTANEYYVDAFKTEFESLWAGTEFSRSDIDMNRMCYYRALNCYFGSEQADIIDRRNLMFYYLKNIYGIDRQTSTLNKHRSILPVDSIVARTLKRVCKLYDQKPDRIFGNGTAQDIMADIYNDAKIDRILMDGYLLAKLNGIVGMMPYFVNGELHIRTFTPDQFSIKQKEGSLFDVSEFWYPVYNMNEKAFIFRVWTDEERIEYKYEKNTYSAGTAIKILSREPNPYGRIPVVFWRLGGGKGFFSGGLFEMVETNIKINKLSWQADLQVDYNSSPTRLATNIPESEITGAVDEIIALKNVGKADYELAAPDLRYISPSPLFDAIDEYKRDRKFELQRDLGVPASLIEGDSNPPSGISRLLEMQEPLEMKFEDLPASEKFEEQLADIIRIVSNIDNGTNIGELTFHIDYPDEALVIEPDVEYQMDKEKVKDLNMDALAFLKKWGSINDGADINEAKRIIDERRSNYEVLGLFGIAAEEEEVVDEITATPVNDEIDEQLENINTTING